VATNGRTVTVFGGTGFLGSRIVRHLRYREFPVRIASRHPDRGHRYGSRVGLHIVLFEACSTFTRVAACTLALPPIRDTLIEGFSHFVTSMTAPIASGWSGCRVGLAPTGKRRLCTAHANNGPHAPQPTESYSITSSARASSVGGTVKPSALAVYARSPPQGRSEFVRNSA
jgi:hypothetical protein